MRILQETQILRASQEKYLVTALTRTRKIEPPSFKYIARPKEAVFSSKANLFLWGRGVEELNEATRVLEIKHFVSYAPKVGWARSSLSR